MTRRHILCHAARFYFGEDAMPSQLLSDRRWRQ
jgi:hypothetical protein